VKVQVKIKFHKMLPETLLFKLLPSHFLVLFLLFYNLLLIIWLTEIALKSHSVHSIFIHIIFILFFFKLFLSTLSIFSLLYLFIMFFISEIKIKLKPWLKIMKEILKSSLIIEVTF
jgi:hypothetical protein